MRAQFGTCLVAVWVLGGCSGDGNEAEAQTAAGVYAVVQAGDGLHVARLEASGAAEMILWLPAEASGPLLVGREILYSLGGDLVRVSLDTGERKVYSPAGSEVLSALGLAE